METKPAKPSVKIDFSFIPKGQTSFIYFLVICLLTLVVVSESLVIVNLFPSKTTQPSTTTDQITASLPAGRQGQSMATMSVVWEKQPSLAKIIFDSPTIAVSGADAILTFDPKLVKITKVTPNQDLFNQIFANRTQEASGKIKLTAYLPKKPLIGQQTLATFNFELITKKAAILGLEFTATGQSADSNLVSWESQQDILSRVVPLKVEP